MVFALGYCSAQGVSDSRAISKGRKSEPAAVSTNSEVFRKVVIPAGQIVALDSSLDYSSAVSVAVTLQCPMCTTGATSLGVSGLVVQAYWAVPDGDLFTVAENKAASSFVYWDSGGAIFQVYGPLFRLGLQNKGNQGIMVEQVTIFRRGG